MRPGIVSLLCCLGLLVENAGNGAGRPSDTAEITSKLIGTTVAWQLHWDLIENPKAKRCSTIKVKTNKKQLLVLVDELQWVISYDRKNQQLYPFNVDVLSNPFYLDAPAPFPKEVRERALIPFKGVANASVAVPEYTNSFKRISAYEPNTRKRLVTCFKEEACSREFLSYYNDETGKPIKRVRFAVAPVDIEFPVMMFVVEGVPYIGKIYFDTGAFKRLYSEFTYIGVPEAPWRRAKDKLMEAIRVEGDLLDFKDGELNFVKN